MSLFSRVASLATRTPALLPHRVAARRALTNAAHARRFPARAAVQPREAREPRGAQWTRRAAPMSQSLDQKLWLVDTNIQRRGRVDAAAAIELINQAKASGNVTSTQMQLLLRITGAFIRELPPAQRADLTKQVWALADKNQLDISHYNSLLQAQLENGIKIDPVAVLKELSAAGIEANRVTLQRFIQHYCGIGDMKGATKILENMKAKQMPVNERVFHSFITGHLNAGDTTAAMKMLDLMRSVQLTPSAETYTVLACGLAARGDLDAAVQQMGSQQLTDEQVLRVAKSAALANASKESIAKIIEHLPQEEGFAQDIVNACFELICLKKLEPALTLLEVLPDITKANFFVTHMVRQKYPMEDLLQLCDRFEQLDPDKGQIALRRAAETASEMADSDPETYIKYLKKMQERGQPLRPHYFLPLICRAKNPNEVIATLESARAIGLDHADEILFEFVLARLDTEANPQEVCETLKGLNICAPMFVVNCVIRDLLRKGAVEKCVEFVQAHRGILRGGQCLPALIEAATEANMNSCIAMLEKFASQVGPVNDLPPDFTARFLNGLPDNLIGKAVDAMAMSNLHISRPRFEALKDRHPAIASLHDKVVDNLTETRDDRVEYSSMTVEEVERRLVDFEQRGMNTSSLLRRLVIVYSRAHDMSKAEEVLAKLGEENCTAGVHATLVDLYTYHKHVDKALEHYSKIDADEEGRVLDDYKELHLAALLIENKMLPKAIDMLKNRTFEMELNQLRSLAARLVRNTVATYGLEDGWTLLRDTVSRFMPLSMETVRPVMAPAFETDFAAALRIFKEATAKHRVSPMRREILIRLINEGNTAELDEVVAMLRNAHGTASTNVNLASNYVELGKLDEARQLLNDTPKAAAMRHIQERCRQLLVLKQVELAEKFVKLASECGYHPGQLSRLLIECYNDLNEVDKALEVWTSAQEDNVVLPNHVLRTLAELLERNDRDVPFIVPPPLLGLEDIEDGYPRDRLAGDEDPLVGASLDEALQKVREGPARLNSQSRVASQLIAEGRLADARLVINDIIANLNTNRPFVPQVIKEYAIAVANAGNIDEIQSLRASLSDPLIRECGFDGFVCQAYIAAGRIEDLILRLEQPGAPFASGTFIRIMTAEPKYTERLMRLATAAHANEGRTQLLNDAWMGFMATKQFDRADKLLQDYPAIKERWFFGPLKNSVLAANDEEISARILKATKSAEKNLTKCLGLSLHVDVLLRNGKIDEAHKAVKDAVAGGVDIVQLRHDTLRNLRKELSLRGVSADFPVGPR